jgi:hypothetical protein
MSVWGSAKALHVFKALLKIGWVVKRETGGSPEFWNAKDTPTTFGVFMMAPKSSRECLLESQSIRI